MNLRFQWEPEEWREALLLASARPRRPPKPMMTYAVIGMMAMGSVGEVVNAIRTSSAADYSGSLMPLLLFAGSVVLAIQVYTRARSRSRRVRLLAPMPTEEQQLVMNETGWRVMTANGQAETPVRSWNELREQRTGRRSMILVGGENAFAALPLRVLSATQGGHLHRLITRKLHRVMA